MKENWRMRYLGILGNARSEVMKNVKLRMNKKISLNLSEKSWLQKLQIKIVNW